MLQVHKNRGTEGSSSGPPSWGPGSAQLARQPPGRGAVWRTGVLVASSSPGAQTTWAAQGAAPPAGSHLRMTLRTRSEPLGAWTLPPLPFSRCLSDLAPPPPPVPHFLNFHFRFAEAPVLFWSPIPFLSSVPTENTKTLPVASPPGSGTALLGGHRHTHLSPSSSSGPVPHWQVFPHCRHGPTQNSVWS